MLDKQRTFHLEEAKSVSTEQQAQSMFSSTADCDLFEALLAWQQRQLQDKLQQRLQQQMQQLLDQSHVDIAAVIQDGFQLLREQLQQARTPEFVFERPLGVSIGKGVSPLAGHLDSSAVAALEAAMEAAEAVEEEAATKTVAPPIKNEGVTAVNHVENNKSCLAHPKRKTTVHRLMERTPDEQSPLQKTIGDIMQGTVAHHFIGCCVMANTFTMILQMQVMGNIADGSLGLMTVTDSWSSTTIDILSTVEYLFGTIFLVELLLNVYCFRWKYFLDFFNMADTVIVLFTTVEIFVLEPLEMKMNNVSFFRTLRLAKLARVGRIARLLTFFHGLRVLVATAIHSLASLFWALVIMFILMLVGTIFLCQTLHDFIVDEAADLATRTWVNHMFGSGDRALYTVFEMTFSGCWPNYARRVVKEVSPLYAAFFAVYVGFVIFGMIKIISALFLKETQDQAARDHELMVRLRAKKSQTLKNHLADLFHEADTSGDGTLNLEEMNAMLSHPKVVHWLSELGIDSSDALLLFELLDDGDGFITQQEFVQGIIRIKGEARAQDLVPVMTNVQRILQLCKHISSTCKTLETSVSLREASGHAVSLKCPSLVPSLLPPLSN